MSMINSRRSRRISGVVAIAASLALALSACGGRQEQAAPEGAEDTCEATPGRITIATGNSTGVYFALGGAIATVLNDNTELKATSAETGASVQNIEQLVSDDYDLAFSLADTAADAIAGTGSFSEPQGIQAIGRIHSNYTQVVVRKDSGIKSVEDMKGKRISTGSPKSGTEVIATRLLESAGLDVDSDVQAQRLELGKTVDGMKDGSIDGLFWSGGLPTPALTDLFTSDADKVEFIDVTPLAPKMQEINPVYAEDVIPADTYQTDEDIKTLVVPNVLLVRDDYAKNSSCAITKAIWENIDALAAVHPAAEEFDPKTAQESDPIPLAPGAEEALKELGG